MIKNIVFDIGKIILKDTSSSALNYINIADESKKIIKDNIFDEDKFLDLDYGKLDYKSYFDKYSYLLPDNLKDIAYYALSNSYRLRGVNNNIINLIKELSFKGYNIYILSNNNKDVYNYFKNSNLDKYINGYIVSCFYGLIKPNKEIYNILFDTYKLNPSECYFIDDKKENIEAANKLGMKGFILDWDNNTFEDLVNDMINNNIEVYSNNK